MCLRLWFRWSVQSLGVIAIAFSAAGEVKVHQLFSDHVVLQRDKTIPIWGTAGDGEEVTVSFAGQTKSAKAAAGKWSVVLDPIKETSETVLKIAGPSNSIEVKDVAVGEVWICSGQSNMQWSVNQSETPEEIKAASANPKIRLITIPRRGSPSPLSEIGATWQECGPKTVGDFSAVGYAFAKDIQAKLGVPVGMINTSYGGTPAEAWTSDETLKADPAFAKILEMAKTMKPDSPNRASTLYNAMINNLLPFSLRGAIWYQGESNAPRAAEYMKLFPAMIGDWRKHFGQGDFPFAFVQLAPFMKIVTEPKDSAWAELREAQRLTLTASPASGMAVITDLGDEKDIHPRPKGPVGARLALWARATVYGEKIEYSGPVLESQKIDGDKITLTFTHVGGGLVAKDGALKGFAIAGKDQKFKNAKAEIVGETVVVSCPDVPEPVAVRYGWADYPVVNLWNVAGLPASPFRTDDFPLTTAK